MLQPSGRLPLYSSGLFSLLSFSKVVSLLTFKVHKEQTSDGSALSQMAPNRLTDPCQPLWCKLWGPIMSSASDTRDKWCSQPTFKNIRKSQMDVWQADASTDMEIQIELLYHHCHRHVHVHWFPKKKKKIEASTGWLRMPYHLRRHWRLSERTSIN